LESFAQHLAPVTRRNDAMPTIQNQSLQAPARERPQADPLARWHADHRNFARVLDLIELQVDAFRAERRPDYELMQSIVYYLRHYPDRFHHPREDVAFARMVERDPTLQLPIARRMQEHAVIAAAGDELLARLEEVIGGGVVERSTLEIAIATYLVYYRHHLTAEERFVIPRAVEVLDSADWAAVAAIPTEPDPLFGADSDTRYRELRRQVSVEAEATD
jgi:hemerythrin-like domain-containing protein